MLQSFFWKRLLLSAILEFAALSGAPLRPKDIEYALRPPNAIVAEERSGQEEDEPLPK